MTASRHFDTMVFGEIYPKEIGGGGEIRTHGALLGTLQFSRLAQ